MDLVMDTVNRDFMERGEVILRMRMDAERTSLSDDFTVGRSAS